MKHFIYATAAIVIVGILQGCSDDSDLVMSQEMIVVQAYLYAHEPVNDIRLTRTLPLDVETDTEPEPVNDADIRLIKEEMHFALDASPGDSGYYHYPGDDLVVRAGELFTLQVEHEGQLLQAQTIVPEAPEGVTISRTSTYIPDVEDIFLGEIDMNDLIVSVNWNNYDEALYFVTVENIENNPQSISDEDGFLRGGNMRRRMVFRPTRMDEFRISPMQFEYYGSHLIKVYQVNQEYADLFDSQEQDSRTLNEPLTNIQNGLGIFSAFHSNTDSIFLTVNE